MNRYSLFSLAVLLVLICSGCSTLVLGGAAAYGGHKGATDERSIGTMLDDSLLSTTIKSKMIADDFVKARNIDVDVLNGVVFLIGVVESSSQKRMAADLARGIDGVRRVENQLLVGKTSPGQLLDDTISTSRIKTALLKAAGIRSTNIDVDTNNNVVTLTGIVQNQKQKNEVLYIVQNVVGNRQVIDNLSVAD